MTVIYSLTILAVTSKCHVKRVICKELSATLVNSADQDQTPQKEAFDQCLQCLLKLLEVKGEMKQSQVSIQAHFPRLYSEIIDLPVLSVL